MVRKFKEGGTKKVLIPSTPYTVKGVDINSSGSANVKPITPLQAYDLKRNTERRKLETKRNEAISQENKRISANKTLKNGNVVSALLGQDHSGAKTKPIMVGNYNLANNPVMRVADGLVQTLYGNQPAVSALNNNSNYSTRQILDAGSTNAEEAYHTGNGVIDFLNPLNIGNGVVQSWASAPLEAQQSNSYLPYLKAAGNTYLAAGLPGTGKLLRYAAPEMMNTVDATKRLYGNKINKVYNHVTTNTPLADAYKLNPFRYKGSEDKMYRGIGNEGFEDAMTSKVLRSKQNVTPQFDNTGKFQLNKQFGNTYYTPKFGVAENYGNGYIAEVSKDSAPFFKRYGNKEWSQQTPKDIPIDEARILKKHWLKGYVPENLEKYELSNNPFRKQLPGPSNAFKSEIDWAKWNKEIPSNQPLLQEYNAIEKATKANGDWMKNPDGSTFQGTPEQFVQQQSQNFKNAFPEYHGEILNHNTDAKLNTIDEAFFNKGAGDTGYYGKGTYTHPKKEYTKMYGKNNYEFYLNSKNRGFLDKSNIDDSEYFKRSDDEILKHHLPEYENKLMNYELNPSRYYDNAKENWLNKLNEQVKAGKISRDKLDKFTSLHNTRNGEVVIPFNNRVKSAVGNNGMFDMTNPNIYKAIIPTAVGIGALQQKKQGGRAYNNLDDVLKKLFG